MISEKEMLETLDVNVKGVMLCARRAISSMNKHRVDGHIININRYLRIHNCLSIANTLAPRETNWVQVDLNVGITVSGG